MDGCIHAWTHERMYAYMDRWVDELPCPEQDESSGRKNRQGRL